MTVWKKQVTAIFGWTGPVELIFMSNSSERRTWEACLGDERKRSEEEEPQGSPGDVARSFARQTGRDRSERVSVQTVGSSSHSRLDALPPPWRVRWWSPSDLASLAAFRVSGNHAYETDAQQVIRDAAEMLEARPSLGCYVAIEDGTDKIIGAIVFTVGAPDDVAHINAVAVAKDRRREGIATSLKQRAIDFFAKSGVRRYYSDVDPSNYRMNNLNRLKFGLSSVSEDGFLTYSADIVVESD